MTKLITGSLLAMFLAGAVPAMAQTTTDLTCMQNAVSKRETSIIAAFDAFSATGKTSLTTRQSSLIAAWGINNLKERRAAIKAAWQAFRASAKDAKKALNDSRKAAWQQFKSDAKACYGGKLLKEEAGSVSAEAAL